MLKVCIWGLKVDAIKIFKALVTVVVTISYRANIVSLNRIGPSTWRNRSWVWTSSLFALLFWYFRLWRNIIDKKWIYEANRLKSLKYSEGVWDFMSLALNYADSHGQIRCPCKKCKNVLFQRVQKMKNHLFIIRFDQSYTYWVFHRESITSPYSRVVILEPKPSNGDSEENINDDMREMNILR